MKKSIIIFASIISTLISAGTQVSESTIPQLVSINFHYQFPGANIVNWEKDNNNYKANYRESGKDLSVFYNAKGQIVEIDREIDIAELPELYINRLQSFFKGSYTIAHLVVADDFSTNPYYLMEVIHDGITYELQFADYQLDKSTLHHQRQNTYVW